ncbi:hypothetical protein WISP_94734 [Willisornis vidua]|uniref:Uncharacterized protein n=1 Tax=Willisornis vidua TaxID=1566151 RepID=A0ABQ9D5M5_9PASS|nr:hypothetical protein WISP_94734 [Willisornis vidua]
MLDALRADLPDSRGSSRSCDRQVTERRVPSDTSDEDGTKERPQSRSRSHFRSQSHPCSPRIAHGKKRSPKSKPRSERGWLWASLCALGDTTDTPNQTGTQINQQETIIAPVVKRKSWIGTSEGATLGEGAGEGTSASFSIDDTSAGPSTEGAKQLPGTQERLREIRPKTIISRSLTPAELRDIRKEYRHSPGERILTWVLQCRDGGAGSYVLNGQETQHLGTIARDDKIEKEMAKELGYKLLPAFNTTSALPYPRVNLKFGVRHPEARTGTETDTCTACAPGVCSFKQIHRHSYI